MRTGTEYERLFTYQPDNKAPRKLLSPWIIEDGYCAVRIIDGGSQDVLADRIAFIEKTPRVRVSPFTAEEDCKNWECGPKGDGGSGDHETLGQMDSIQIHGSGVTSG